jgi:SAM-dependent methyltransferase
VGERDVVTNRNIPYNSDEILAYYSCSRRAWEEFYPSERHVIDLLAARRSGSLGSVLDVGCACGGLGEALSGHTGIDGYTGVDIHEASVAWAQDNLELGVSSRFIAGDILDLDLAESFDTVFSLSCVDWNVETEAMLEACWEHVRPGGYFVLSLRLSPSTSVNDIARSFQYVDFTGANEDAEVANYVVFSLPDAVRMLASLEPAPDLVGAYGYWGAPSETARTPFERICFAVCYVRKPLEPAEETRLELDVPADLLGAPGEGA